MERDFIFLPYAAQALLQLSSIGSVPIAINHKAAAIIVTFQMEGMKVVLVHIRFIVHHCARKLLFVQFGPSL